MTTETFYSTTAQVCFVLLGFWWAVVQFRHGEWMPNRARRHMAYTVSLHFLLPGIMSLVSLLSANALFLWRATFFLASVTGIIATVLVMASQRAETSNRRFVYVGNWLVVLLYALVALFAFSPETARALTGLQALELESILLSLLVFLGVNVAWSLFTEQREKA